MANQCAAPQLLLGLSFLSYFALGLGVIWGTGIVPIPSGLLGWSDLTLAGDTFRYYFNSGLFLYMRL
jgi:hypothetical protein